MEKLKVGILGGNKIARFLLTKLSEKENRFELYKQNTWNQDFTGVGVLDILWICKSFKSNRKLKKETLKLIAEYSPTLCLIAVPVKPFTVSKLQQTIKDLGLKTNLVLIGSSCPEIIIDWNRYVSMFSLMIGWDLKGSLLLAKTHLVELQIQSYSIEGSFNLEISSLLINSQYLLYNYWEQRKAKIFRYYERKNKEVERNKLESIQYETNEGLMHIQKPNLIMPSLAKDCETLDKNILKLLPNNLRFRFLIKSSKTLEKIKTKIVSRIGFIKLKIKGRSRKIKRIIKHGKLSNSLRNKSSKKTL